MSISKTIKDLPEKQKPSNYKDEILSMLNKGYSYRECAKILNNNVPNLNVHHTTVFKIAKGERQNED